MVQESKRGPVVVVGRWRYHEIGLMVTGIVLFVAWSSRLIADPTALLDFIPRMLIDAWFVANGLGGLVGLVGILMPRRHIEKALKLEQAGNLLMAAAGILYGTAVLDLAGRKGFILVAFLFLMWVCSSLGRVCQIRSELRKLREADRE